MGFHTRLSINKDDSMDEAGNQQGTLIEEAKPEIKEPSMYQVVLLNDDYTPMDFVVQVLVDLFAKSQLQATKIMLQVHHEGKGVCGKFSSDVAETKVSQVNDFAKENSHPLISIMEKVSG